MQLEPGQRLDQYTIVRRLGQGGMGTVYHARDAAGHPVVLKVPSDALLADPGTQARYERELEIARALDHPNIQRLLATGRMPATADTPGMPYTVLEWADGSLLRQRLCEGQPLATQEAVSFATQLCDALDYCHRHGIVHRDLKPDNVLITPDGQVKLLDFGAAMLEGGRKVTTASISPALGTPDYMSPEQVLGQRGDARSDVYSLGVMLYEMLTGSPPYGGDNALAVMAQHVQSRPVPVRSRNRQVSTALSAVVARALRRDPARRYQSMRALREDLQHLDRIDPDALAAEDSQGAAAGGAATRSFSPFWRLQRGKLAAALIVAALAVALILVLLSRGWMGG